MAASDSVFAVVLRFIRSSLFAVIFYGFSVVIVVSAFFAQYVSVDALRWLSNFWGRYHYICARLILGIRVVVDGDLTQAGVLYAIKHESMFETIEMLRLFKKPAVVAKKELSDIPFWGRVADRYGMIYVDRDGGAKALRAMMASVKGYVAQNRPIIIFPEGTRVPHGQRAPLQSGFAGLYRVFNLPVVPVALNSGLLSPKASFLKRAGIITMKVGEPIPPGLPREEIEARVLDAINAMNSDPETLAHQIPSSRI